MRKNVTIKEVAEYWDKSPVHSVEFDLNTDLKEFYDRVDIIRWSDNERWAQNKFYDIVLGNDAKILDAGCGIGVFSRFYAKKGFNVYAIDVSQKALEITRKSIKSCGLKAEIKHGSVEDIPYPDNFFDYIVSNGVIHHTPNTEKAVNEFWRVLKPGGIASVCVYYKNIFLREPFWYLVKLTLPFLMKKKDGREMFFSAKTPEDFVRVYDGNNTPIAKVYSKTEADELFNKFKHIAAEPHYFPVRFLKLFKVGGFIHEMLDKTCGCLIYYLLQKPKDNNF